jgi:hypothetical protein
MFLGSRYIALVPTAQKTSVVLLVVADHTEDVAAAIVAWRSTAATSVLHSNEQGVATLSTVACVT